MGEWRWSQGAGRKKKHCPHRGPRFRSAPRRSAGPIRRSLPAQSPSILTPPPVSRRHSPNRNRLLGKGVSGRARNAKPGNLREPEPSLQHRKTAGQQPRRKGGGAIGQRAELQARGTPARGGEALEAKGAFESGLSLPVTLRPGFSSFSHSEYC